MNTIDLQKDELQTIVEFMSKHPTVNYITLTADDSSGIGTALDASFVTVINGDIVTLIKHITEEDSF